MSTLVIESVLCLVKVVKSFKGVRENLVKGVRVSVSDKIKNNN